MIAQPLYGQNDSPEDRNVVNWHYAATFGTGVYKIGEQTVFVVRVPLYKTLMEDSVSRKRLRLSVPVSFGFHDFDVPRIIGQTLSLDFQTVSITPGLEYRIDIRPNWTLTTYANVGGGTEFFGDTSAWLWGAGIKSRYRFVLDAGWTMDLGNAITSAGYRADDGDRQGMASIVTGLNFLRRLENRIFDRPADVGLHVIYYMHFHDVDFREIGRETLQVHEEFEIGATLGLTRPISVLGLDIDRLGVGYRFGDGLSAIRLVGSLPF